MSILPAIPVQDSVIADFRGPWLRISPTDVPSSEALLSLNAEYGPHFVGTRFGFNTFWAAGKVIPVMYNWVKAPDGISTDGNYLVIHNATDGTVQLVDLVTLTPYATPLFSVTAEGISVETEGNQVIIASFQSTGGGGSPIPIGAALAHVIGIFPFAVYTETAFLQPLSTKPLLANVNVIMPGIVTAGIHSVGYIITSNNGFLGRPSPVDVSSGLFDTTSNIQAPGGQNIAFQITANWPAGANGIQIVMS